MSSLVKQVTWILGVVLLLVGIAGFFVDGTLIIFQVDPIHNVVHILSGVVGLAAAGSGESFSRLYLIVFGLVYALVWETLFGSLVDGARTLSVQQWALAVAQKVTDGGLVTSDVGLPTAVVLLTVVTAGATWFAGQKLRTLKLAGEE